MMDNLQAMMNGMSVQWQRDRAQHQLTLGDLIKVLEDLPEDSVLALGKLDSYRGYYCDLAFSPGNNTAGDVLTECRSAMGKAFTGYKGGDFVMGELTPLWVADYGCTGMRLMAITDGQLELAEDDS